MQAFSYLTLGILIFVLLGQKFDPTNPCSQFSDPDRQSLCSSDNYPTELIEDEEN
jgi:CO dehydrogenase/acetyl-CoA synthase beta subunit